MRFLCQRNQQCAFGPRAKYKRMELAPRLCPYLAAPRSHRHSTEPVHATDLAAGKSRISPSELQECLKGQGTSSLLSTEGSAGICCSTPMSNAAPRLQEVKKSPQNLVRAAPLVVQWLILLHFFFFFF